jgi:outer membrane protein
MRLVLPPPGAALCLALVLGAPAAAAQSAGDTFVQSGPLWLEPVRTRTAYVRTVLDDSAAAGLLVPRSFGSPALRIEPAGARTLGLSFAHFFTDRLAVELDIGVPPRVEAMGSGRDAPPGLAGPAFAIDLGDPRINPLGSQRQWSPVLALQYRFAPARRWRPFVAAGATYTWFTHEELNPAFVRRLDERFGQALATAAARPGPTTAVAATPDAWAPLALGAHLRGRLRPPHGAAGARDPRRRRRTAFTHAGAPGNGGPRADSRPELPAPVAGGPPRPRS